MNVTLRNNKVGLGRPFNWPSRSPDLSPMDISVGTEELRARIINEFEVLGNNPDLLKRANHLI